MSNLVKSLRLCAEDPMWDAHAEVSKTLLDKAIDRIETLETALEAIANPDNCLMLAETEEIARAALDKDA